MEKRDILRCNSKLYGEPRFDRVVVNTELMSFGRIHALFTIQSDEHERHDIALLQTLEPSSSRVNTMWEECRIFEEKEYEFVFVKYMIRGCHFVPTFERTGKQFILMIWLTV